MTHRDCDEAFELSWLDLVWPENLAMSLRWAGALCAAWCDGNNQYTWRDIINYRREKVGPYFITPGTWTPGCGQPNPRVVNGG